MLHNGKIAVAMVEPIGGHSGNDFYDFGLCKALAEQGARLVFYTCDETTLDQRFAFPFATEKPFRRIYGTDPKWLRGMRYVLGSWRTVTHAVRNRLQLAHLHIYHFASRELLNLLLFRMRGFRIVATIHDVENFETYGQQPKHSHHGAFMSRLDRIIVHSDYARQSVLRHFKGYPPDRIHVVPHGDADFLFKRPLLPQEARRQLHLPLDARIVLFFGQIKKVKGLDVLLNAWAIVRQRNPRAHLVVVGRPWKVEQEIFDRIVREKQLESSCTFNYAYIPNEDIPVYYAAADLVVLPYREIYSSGVMVRSLDYGAAIVASDLSAFRNIITDNDNGLLFRNEDAVHLAERILEVLDDDVRLQQLRERAHQTAEQRFSWNQIGSQVMEVYHKALHERQS
ncbi:MAG: glycosyltransferase family 4 protein [Chitinophagales bacterium]|nr:glycosyltransferase family 4 protein [Chitinophagales bacterium]MDW8393566.1 glycosyltransferase family 4 protein [Chitinophagales bacterium]